ncbi:Na/Pi symporter [Echinimonas agarilytica]|uniref:Na/Pi symporter n=1 Tax=Echinimonas agarilytica TaxID=1215918 RepID=A0AA41W878_9GAMM|nr:Na/Pi symporter [Echinimonas agarilytica]MCM2680656.1 Na/Pi symporter [Echinimonas agarilytica]
MTHASDDYKRHQWLKWVGVALSTYFILVAVNTIGNGFKEISGGSDGAQQIFEFASHPVAALLLGVIATSLVQSSSTVTSVIVGLVAGGLPLSMAVPMIMGANIGTTVTNTIVSLGHLKQGQEFRRAFAASTIHDFFNWLAVLLLLPLELAFGFLEKSASAIVSLFIGSENLSMSGLNFMKPLLSPADRMIEFSVSGLSGTSAALAMIIMGMGMILCAVTFLSRLLRAVMVGRAKLLLQKALGRGPLSGVASGAAVTVLVQSSSTTTSLIVPLVGSGTLSLREVYPFTLGANIGTTITAILAATAITGPVAHAAMTIAVIHLLFNISSTLLIYGIPMLRNIPLWCAEKLSELAASPRQWVAAGYLASAFFAIPGGILAVSN